MIAAVPGQGAAAAGWRGGRLAGGGSAAMRVPQDVPRGNHIPLRGSFPATEVNSSFYPTPGLPVLSGACR